MTTERIDNQVPGPEPGTPEWLDQVALARREVRQGLEYPWSPADRQRLADLLDRQDLACRLCRPDLACPCPQGVPRIGSRTPPPPAPQSVSAPPGRESELKEALVALWLEYLAFRPAPEVPLALYAQVTQALH